MTLGTSALGTSALGVLSGDDPPLIFSATIEQRITQLEYQFHAIIEQRIYTPLQFSAVIEQRIVQPSLVFSATIEQRIYTPVQFSAVIEQRIYGSLTGTWKPVVHLDGVDISALIEDEITPSSEEGGSTIASLTFSPPAGTVDLLAWINKPVTVDYWDNGALLRRFTGVCATPKYAPAEGTVTLECTSDMQGALEAQPRAAIDSIVAGGQWSKDIFDDNADGWKYAQDLASTVPGSLWSDKHRAVRFTPWAAKATPDVILTEADIIDGKVEIRHASKREMIKRNLIEFDYQFFNLRTRQHFFNLQYDRPICEILAKAFKFPTKEMIRSAAEANGWQLDSISYTDLPETQWFDCPGGRNNATYKYGLHNKDYGKVLCMGASFRMSKRWAQRVRENYLIDVRCEDDLAIANQFAVRGSWHVPSTYDPQEWENQPVRHVGLSKAAFNPLPSGGNLHPGGSGDYSEEADTARRAEMEQAQRTILAKASTEILATHRKTEVTFSIRMRPHIDLSSTIRIVTPQVTAQGKVVRIDETLSVESGKAISRITLAISRKAGVGLETGSPIEPVERPAATQETPFKRGVRLGWRIGGVPKPGHSGTLATGGMQGAEDNADEFNGYSTNYEYADPDDPSLLFYPERMTVIAPEIEQAAVDATLLAAEKTVTVAVPEDLLTLTK